MIKKIIYLVLIILLVIVAFRFIGFKKDNINLIENYISLDDLDRRYLVYLPSNYNPSIDYPVVFAFHGGGSNANSMVSYSKFYEQAEKDNFIVVFPEALGNESNRLTGLQANWNDETNRRTYASQNNINDVGFFDALLEDVSNKYSVDSKRIYLTGISNGGMISYRIACERSAKIAAIAVVASTRTFVNCSLENPVPVLHIQGTEDIILPYNGGDSNKEILKPNMINGGPYLSVFDSVVPFKIKNSCSNVTQRVFSNGSVTCESYLNCSSGNVEICTINGGGHTWPGAKEPSFLLKKYMGQTTKDLNANEYIWNFFQKYSLD